MMCVCCCSEITHCVEDYLIVGEERSFCHVLIERCITSAEAKVYVFIISEDEKETIVNIQSHNFKLIGLSWSAVEYNETWLSRMNRLRNTVYPQCCGFEWP